MLVSIAAIVVRKRIFRIELKRLVVSFDRLFVLPSIVQLIALFELLIGAKLLIRLLVLPPELSLLLCRLRSAHALPQIFDLCVVLCISFPSFLALLHHRLLLTIVELEISGDPVRVDVHSNVRHVHHAGLTVHIKRLRFILYLQHFNNVVCDRINLVIGQTKIFLSRVRRKIYARAILRRLLRSRLRSQLRNIDAVIIASNVLARALIHLDLRVAHRREDQ